MAYTKEEIQSFEEKDKRITKLSCLNRATDIAIAFWTHPSVKQIDPTNILTEGLPEVCKIADVFVNWVYEKDKPMFVKPAVAVDDVKKGELVEIIIPNIPVPVKKQQDILDAVLIALRAKYPNKLFLISNVQKRVYEQYKKYPENPQSVSKIVDELQI